MMDATVRARVDGDLKQEAEAIFKKLGLSTSQAIVMFLNMVKLNNGIPFEVKIPNKKTLKAMQEAKELIGDEIDLEDL
ncbi:MAG: type II toxin-antitoxin system RelB/DinJ family antitoxin [Sulfurimonas sp.]|jgi:DNA-damage-inducible protein J|nr:type II toxin-antitoxin system RelB/DinJ family antitoxin [Sulfurimonadaceae bacterium]